MKHPLHLLLLLCLTAPAARSHAAGIDTSCGNYAQLVRAGRHWAYWCHGRGSAWSGEFVCDCLRSLFFQRRRLACERSGRGRQEAQQSVMRSCERIKHAIDFRWIADCTRGVDRACRIRWTREKYTTGLCGECNAGSCRGVLQEAARYDDWCSSFKVVFEEPAQK